MAPMNAWLTAQGIETLAVRMERHVASAAAVAAFLESHPKVTWVSYAGLPSSRYRGLAAKYLPRAASCGRDDFREIWGGKAMRNRHRHAW